MVLDLQEFPSDMKKRQALFPDEVLKPCPYCDGRGFLLVETKQIDVPEKELHPDSVIECKFCGGTGSR